MKNTLSIVFALLIGVAIGYLGKPVPSTIPASSDTTFVVDTVRVPSPYPVLLPGKPIPVEDTHKLDSLKRVYADSIGALVDALAKPFISRYDDTIRTSYITALPIEKTIKDSTVYKPLPVLTKIVTNNIPTEPSAWEYIQAGAVGVAIGAILVLIAH